MENVARAIGLRVRAIFSASAITALVVAALLLAAPAPIFAQSIEVSDCAAYLDEKNGPSSFALIVDRSGSMTTDNAMQRTIEAIVRFVQDMRPGDEAAVVSFGSNVKVEAPFTADKRRLIAAAQALRPAGATRLNDAIAAGARLLSERQGSRVLIVFTDGVENASSLSERDVQQMNIGENALTYTIGLGQVDHNALQRFAATTGGRYEYAQRAADMSDVYSRVQADYYQYAEAVLSTTGGLTVHSLPAGRPVAVNGQVVGETPLRLNGVDPRTHRVEVQFGRGVWACNVPVTVGTRAVVSARERDVPLTLVIETAPTRAAVFLNDDYVGMTAMTPSIVAAGGRDISRQLAVRSLMPGTYRVRVVAAPEYDFSPNQSMEFEFTLRDRSDYVKALIFMGQIEDMAGNRTRVGSGLGGPLPGGGALPSVAPGGGVPGGGSAPGGGALPGGGSLPSRPPGIPAPRVPGRP